MVTLQLTGQRGVNAVLFSGRPLLITRGAELHELFRGLVDVLQKLSSQPRRRDEKDLHFALAENAGAALWGTAKAMLASMRLVYLSKEEMCGHFEPGDHIYRNKKIGCRTMGHGI